MRIPRILHRIWLGDAPIPDQAEAFWQLWRRWHPGWDFRTWTDSNRPKLQNEKSFNHTSNLGLRSDVLRYELLLQFGGVYVDTDMEPLKCIEPLIQFCDCFSAREYKGHDGRKKICPAIIGATPGHAGIRALVMALPERVSRLATDKLLTHDEVVDATGPSLVTDVWLDVEQATVFEARLFYPFHWDHKNEQSHLPFPDAFAKHHWGNTWPAGR